MIQLIIKGKKETAIKAARSRILAPMRFVSYLDVYENTIVEVDDRAELIVVSWFCSGPKEAPFPPGTLLHYTFRPDRHDGQTYRPEIP